MTYVGYFVLSSILGVLGLFFSINSFSKLLNVVSYMNSMGSSMSFFTGSYRHATLGDAMGEYPGTAMLFIFGIILLILAFVFLFIGLSNYEKVIREQRHQQETEKNVWVCTCGKENAQYIGTCSCGREKPNNITKE